ncbi:MAG: hypothetical protein GY760_28450 [Deltaproteobacteria bacterium]|nr:hypothetical protein [Deltaproteobacteria bacterium]
MIRNNKISKAISYGDIETVKSLITNESNIMSYIVIAIEHEQFEIVKYLIDICTDLDEKIRYIDIKSSMPAFKYEGRTLLIWAIIEGHPDIASLLINQGASIEVTDEYKMTALHYAAQFGCVEGVKLLLERNAEIDLFAKGRYTPLMLAMERPTPYYVRSYALETKFKVHNILDNNKDNLVSSAHLLLNAGANITYRDGQNNTLLHSAASIGDENIVLSLIDRGLGINVKGEDKETPLTKALVNYNEDAALVLLSKGAEISENSVWQAAKISGTLVKEVIAQGGDVNKLYSGRSCVHYAANLGISDAVKVLLDHNVEVDSRDEDDHTPLYNAVDNEDEFIETAKILVANGADINIRSSERNPKKSYGSYIPLTPYEVAKKRNHKNICRYMLEYTQKDEQVLNKAEEDNLKREFFKAVNKAIESGHVFYIEDFIKCDINFDINIKNNQGKTALHIAADEGCLKVFTFLVKNGADINEKNRKEEVPADIAKKKSHDEIIFFLKYNIPQLKEKVSVFSSLLFSPVTDDDLNEAALYLIKNNNLWTAVTSRELEYFLNSRDDSIIKLGKKIKEARQKKLYNTSTGCNKCGRDTLVSLRQKIISGSPSTMSYEADYYYRCASCGTKDSFSF